MPDIMTRKRPKHGEESAPGRQPQRRSGKPVQVYLSDEMHEALLAYVASARPRPSITAVVEMALEDLLRKAGHLPPAEGGGQ